MVSGGGGEVGWIWAGQFDVGKAGCHSGMAIPGRCRGGDVGFLIPGPLSSSTWTSTTHHRPDADGNGFQPLRWVFALTLRSTDDAQAELLQLVGTTGAILRRSKLIWCL